MFSALRIAGRVAVIFGGSAIVACTTDRPLAPELVAEFDARLSKGPSCKIIPGKTSSIALTPPTRSASLGESWQYSAVTQDGVPIDACALVWTSSNEGLVTINQVGVATAVGIGGPVTITASTDRKKAIIGTASVVVLPDLSTGLLAYYPFSESASDMSGNNRNGIPFGVTLVADRHGNAASAYAFNGGYIDIGTLDFAGDFSMSAWINIDEPRGGGFAVLSNLNGQGYEFIAVTCDDTNSEETPAQCTSPDTDYLRLHTNLDPCCNLSNTITATTTPLFGGRWHHVASTYSVSTGTASLYVDGTLVKQRSGMAATQPSGVSTRIGQSGYGGNPFFGVIDEVRVYGRALSAAEVGVLAGMP